MALHGKIEINGQAIGSWQARRREFPMPKGRPNTYECVVTMYADASAETFIVRHNMADGALVLASKVLLTAHALRDISGGQPTDVNPVTP